VSFIGAIHLFPFRRQKEGATNKETALYREPDGDDEVLDSILHLLGRAAMKQKRRGSQGRPGKTPNKGKDSMVESHYARDAADRPEQ
jgi:hypothetical protein